MVMHIKSRIIQSFLNITDAFKEVQEESFIIGASALILLDIQIGTTSDIDILTSSKGAEKLKASLKEFMEIAPNTKEDDLFYSNFARFNLPLMDIEVMGDLKVKKEGVWLPVTVNEYLEISEQGLSLRVPTLKEQNRILSLFGRKKDQERIKLINQHLQKHP